MFGHALIVPLSLSVALYKRKTCLKVKFFSGKTAFSPGGKGISRTYGDFPEIKRVSRFFWMVPQSCKFGELAELSELAEMPAERL